MGSVGSSASWAAPGPQGLVLTYGAATHPGNVRTVNEDGWLARPPVFLVADGMGGHRAGDVASSIVVSEFDHLVDSGLIDLHAVEDTVARCRTRIEALADGEAAAPGSTLVAAVHVVEEGTDYWLVANIGDSRAYLSHEGRLEQLSHDHSRVQELIDAGQLAHEDAARHPERNVITRALGPISGSPVDYSLIPVEDGTVLLLCSDGVTGELDDSAVSRLLVAGPGARESAEAVVGAAVEAGGHDNATAVVVHVRTGRVTESTLGDPTPASTDTIPGRRTR